MTSKEAARMIDISAVRTPHGLADIEYVVEVAKKIWFYQCTFTAVLDENGQ